MLPNIVDTLFSLLPAGRSAPASPRNVSLENPNVSLNDPEVWEALTGMEARSDSGLTVTPEIMLQFGPVYQCCEIKSGDIAASTLHCHRREVEPEEDDIDNNMAAERLCSLEWNDLTPANEGWQNLVFHYELWGNGYAYIGRQDSSANAPPRWMANLPPTSITPCMDPDLGLLYHYQTAVMDEWLYPWEVFHLKKLAIDNNRAIRLASLLKNEVGLGLAAKKFLSKFFERGASHGGVLMLPPAMSKEARDRVEKGVRNRSSSDNWFKTMVLQDGAKWQSTTVDPQQAQMHEMSDDEARAVCHFFNMPPWKLGIRDSESYNSAEQAQRAYVTGALLHGCTRIQGECSMKLLSARVRRSRSHEFRHNFSKLLEPDVKTMNEVLEIQRRNEVINANEWRRKIRISTRHDDKAEEFYNPNTRSDRRLAATAEDTSDDTADTSQQSASGEAADTVSKASVAAQTHSLPTARTAACGDLHLRLLRQSVDRIVRRIGAVAKNKSKRPNDLLQWCDTMAVEHRVIISDELEVPLELAAGPVSSVKLLASQQWMLTQFVGGVAVFLEPPHLTADLSRNVTQFCDQFAMVCFDRWKTEIFDASI